MIKSQWATLFLSILLLVVTAGGAQARTPVDSTSKATISRSDNHERCENVSSKLDRQYQRLINLNKAVIQTLFTSEDAAVQSTVLKSLACNQRAAVLLNNALDNLGLKINAPYKQGALERAVDIMADKLYKTGIDKKAATKFLIEDTEQSADLVDEQLQQAENYLKLAAGH